MADQNQKLTSSAKQKAVNVNLLDQIMEKTRLAPQDEGYDVARKGVSAFIANMLDGQEKGEKVNKALVDRMIAELDSKISGQMDLILHHQKFQELESAWRGLKLLIDRTDFRENIEIEILHVTKEELLEDFEIAPEITQSGLYKHVYSAEYGQFGGQPFAAIVGNYAFSPSNPDMKLLQFLASVGAMSHAPFLSSVAPSFFDIDNFESLPQIKELSSIFEGPRYTKWRALRENEDSRYLGLTAPRFLLRTPYDPIDNPVKTFNYEEDVRASHNHYL